MPRQTLCRRRRDPLPLALLQTADARVRALAAAARSRSAQSPSTPNVSAAPYDPLSATATDSAVAYGLYAVIVHAGESASSGHYFSFCRRSDAPGSNLSLTDCPHAPWVKFNDASVAPISWQEWTHQLDSSIHETAYVLFYRRLSGLAAESALRRWHAEGAPSLPSALEAAGIEVIDAAAASASVASASAAPTTTSASMLTPASEAAGDVAPAEYSRETPVAADSSHIAALDQPEVLPAAVSSETEVPSASSTLSSPPAWASRVLLDNASSVVSSLLARVPSLYIELEDCAAMLEPPNVAVSAVTVASIAEVDSAGVAATIDVIASGSASAAALNEPDMNSM